MGDERNDDYERARRARLGLSEPTPKVTTNTIRATLGAQPPLRFNGPEFQTEQDRLRLSGQVLRIFKYMEDGAWHTLPEIEAATGDPPASISAQLRHLRKERFGSHTVERRARGDRSAGLFEYRVIVSTPPPAPVVSAAPAPPPAPEPAEQAKMPW